MVHKRGLARLIAICALSASVMLVLAACGASTSGGYEAGSTPKESSGGSGSSGGNGNITVTEKEFSITPNKVSAPAGNITFTIKNTGSVAHDITVNVGGTPQSSPLVQPGKTETWSVTIDTPGTYDMYCSVPGHKEAGMNGSLEVTGAGSTGSGSASGSGSTAGGTSTVNVSEKEFAITPSDVTANPGKITFQIKNTGAVAHDITINVNGTPQSSPLVQPGKTESWSVTIDKPGTYDMYCSVPGHKEAGMNGSLKVGS